MVQIHIDDELFERFKEAARNAGRYDLCGHLKYCEVVYNHAPNLTFLLCRDCWNEEVRLGAGDNAPTIKPKQSDVHHTKCMECGKSLDGCGCR